MSAPIKDQVQATLLEMLGVSAANLGTDVKELGLNDSSDLLDVILAVEQKCNVMFNPEAIGSEGALTLEHLAEAFV